MRDQMFHWLIRRKISWNEEHDDRPSIPVQHSSGGATLLVDIGFCRAWGYTDDPILVVTPALISRCIERAIYGGLGYTESGPAMKLDCCDLVPVSQPGWTRFGENRPRATSDKPS